MYVACIDFSTQRLVQQEYNQDSGPIVATTTSIQFYIYAPMLFLPHNITKKKTIMSAMAFHVALLLAFVLTTPPLLASAAAPPSMFPVAQPNCVDHCGNISIPFPFGTTEHCSASYSFLVTCNTSFNPPKLFMQNTSIEITNISLDGQLKLLQYIAKDCYARNGTGTFNNDPTISLPIYLNVNNTANKFTILGCDTYGFISGRRLNRNYETGCTAMCDSMDDLSEGSCGGLGCCQTTIPKQVWRAGLRLRSYNNHTYVRDFNNCSYAFLVEESYFSFSRDNFTNLRNVDKLPMVVDWAIGNSTCKEAQTNSSSYACKSGLNSECYEPSNGYGYRCSCRNGYRGNPYLNDGCQDIDECSVSTLNNCEKICVNTQGSFQCRCPKGYRGDGIKDKQGCVRGESLVFKLVAGIASGIIVVLFITCWSYFELKRRKLSRMKRKYFLQNGGVLLQEKLERTGQSRVTVSIFSSTDLQKATNNFHTSMVIGQGGYGIVYKGLLTDNTIIAVKKSKEVDPNQIEQFINEVIILSQINHKNVVKLVGCCLETQAPLLVYEFISNGSLFEHIHDKTKKRFLNWDLRLKIAVETAGVLSYLHSDASTPIIHRDVKSANILLDHTFKAKVSDFGTSRLVPHDQTQLSTLVQGTFGYLDPEYMQTNQLTEKSDVYSFGVVLVELLTGMMALSYDRPEEQRNLSSFFLSTLKQECLFDILDDHIVCEGNREQLIEAAGIAKLCLNVRGEDRPSMKEVAMELDGLRLCGKHSWTQTEQNTEEMESLLGERLMGYDDGSGNSTSVGYDSLKDHMILPVSSGR